MPNKNKNKQRCFRVSFLTGKNFRLSLLLLLAAGIFLLPNPALLSSPSRQDIYELTNARRREHGLSPVIVDSRLEQAAALKARAILMSGRFQHNFGQRKFSAWIRDCGYDYTFVGENLAIDFDSAEEAVQAWLDSLSHRRNILSDKFTEIGVAAVPGEFGGRRTFVIVQLFGQPPGQANSHLSLAE